MPAGGFHPGGDLDSPEHERLAAATIDLVLERGFETTTVEALIERAGVRRGAFELDFAGKEDCVLSVVDEGVERFRLAVFSAYEQHSLWPDGMRAAAYAAARWVRDSSRYILFSTMMMNGATDLARTHRDMALQMFARSSTLVAPNSTTPTPSPLRPRSP